jgi:hypothetical protein
LVLYRHYLNWEKQAAKEFFLGCSVDKEFFLMNKQDLKNHITTLKKLRNAHGDQLDAGNLNDLDNSIATFEKELNENCLNMEKVVKLITQALKIISNIVKLITTIKDYLE